MRAPALRVALLWLVNTAAALKPITIHARALAATEHRVIRDTCERLGYAADVVAVAGEERAAILVDCDAEDDEPLVFGVMESLDALGGASALVAPWRGSADEDSYAGALRDHVERFELRKRVAVDATSTWDPKVVSPVAHVEIDGAVDEDGEFDVSRLVVLDGLVDEPLRRDLLGLLGDSGDGRCDPDPSVWTKDLYTELVLDAAGNEVPPPPGAKACWGLDGDHLLALCDEDTVPRPILELQTRLTKYLDPSITLCRVPPACLGDDILPIAANAPQHRDGSDAFDWHIDGDPAQHPPSPWTDAFGFHGNRRRGKPRFISCLVYLPAEWEPAWGAPTRYVDPPSGDIFEVSPRPGRVAIYDQDITHSVTCPNAAAGDRPRYSLVVKFALHPDSPRHAPDFSPHIPPTRVGSAARRPPEDHVEDRASDETPAEDLANRTVPQLKALLRARGLRVGGRKAELIDRLVNVR